MISFSQTTGIAPKQKLPIFLLICPAYLLIFLILTSPSVALSYTYTRTKVPGGKACLYWGKREIPWQLNENGSLEINDSSDLNACIKSFDTWNEPECSDLYFDFEGLTARRDTGYSEGASDNINLVVFRYGICSETVPPEDECHACLDNGGPCCSAKHNCWEHPPGAIAITTTTFHRSTGLIVDADIEMNEARYIFTAHDGEPCEVTGNTRRCTRDNECASQDECRRGICLTRGCVHTDIRNTLTHEVGHVLGLDHTNESQSVMYATAAIGETVKRDLHEVDILGLCDIYPAKSPTLTCLGDVITIVPIGIEDATPNCYGCVSAPKTKSPELFFFNAIILFLLSAFVFRTVLFRKGPDIQYENFKSGSEIMPDELSAKTLPCEKQGINSGIYPEKTNS